MNEETKLRVINNRLRFLEAELEKLKEDINLLNSEN